MINYIAGHLPHISIILVPLTKLSGSTKDYIWMKQHDDAFRAVKIACDQSIPQEPLDMESALNETKPVFLVTDASIVGIGGYICQGTTFEEAQ